MINISIRVSGPMSKGGNLQVKSLSRRIKISAHTQQSGQLSESTDLPDGSSYSRTLGPDPRWGIQAETKNALLRIGDNYEHLAQWVEDWALRRLSRELRDQSPRRGIHEH